MKEKIGIQELQHSDNYFFWRAASVRVIPTNVKAIEAGIVLSPKICPSIISEIPVTINKIPNTKDTFSQLSIVVFTPQKSPSAVWELKPYRLSTGIFLYILLFSWMTAWLCVFFILVFLERESVGE